MKHTSLHPRRSPIERESRLCGFGVFETVGKGVEATKDFAASWANYGLEKSIDAKDAIYSQMKQLWDRETNFQYREEQLRNIAEFFRLASPEMVALIREAFEAKTANSLSDVSDLLDHAKWVEAFATVDVFDDTKVPLADLDMTKGPIGILAWVPGERRQKVFAGYVDRMIPSGVQAKHVGTFGAPLADPLNAPQADVDARRETLVAAAPTILESMRGALGMKDLAAGSAERNIATDVLEDRYVRTGEKVIVNGKEVEARSNLKVDMRKAALGVRSFTDIRDIRNAPQASFVKGAAKMGIIDNEDVQDFIEAGRQKERDRATRISESRKEFDGVTELTKKEKSREAKTIASMWRKTGGFEKIALIVAGVFALQNKGVRNFALLGAGAYAVAKFFGKMDNPLKPLEKLTDSATKSFFKLPGVKDAREAAGIMTPLDRQEAIKQGQIVDKFLDSDDVREEADASITGFRILYDMPLNELAEFVELEQIEGGNKGFVRTWDPAFRAKAEKIVAARGLDKKAAERFFQDFSDSPLRLSPADQERLQTKCISRNAMETGDALTTVYYLIGASNPAAAADVQFVEQARSERGGSYDDIGHAPVTIDGVTRDPLQVMFDVARLGKEEATSETLGRFMSNRLGLIDPPKERKESIEESKFIEKRDELKKYEHEYKVDGAPGMDKVDVKLDANMSAFDRGNVVEVGQSFGTKLRQPITMTKQEFLAKDAKDIVKLWAKAFAEKAKEDIGKVFKKDPRYPLFDLQNKPGDPEIVLFGAVQNVNMPAAMAIAETSIYKLATFTPEKILEKYKPFEVGKTPIPPAPPVIPPEVKDPL